MPLQTRGGPNGGKSQSRDVLLCWSLLSRRSVSLVKELQNPRQSSGPNDP